MAIDPEKNPSRHPEPVQLASFLPPLPPDASLLEQAAYRQIDNFSREALQFLFRHRNSELLRLVAPAALALARIHRRETPSSSQTFTGGKTEQEKGNEEKATTETQEQSLSKTEILQLAIMVNRAENHPDPDFRHQVFARQKNKDSHAFDPDALDRLFERIVIGFIRYYYFPNYKDDSSGPNVPLTGEVEARMKVVFAKDSALQDRLEALNKMVALARSFHRGDRQAYDNLDPETRPLVDIYLNIFHDTAAAELFLNNFFKFPRRTDLPEK